MDWPVYPLIFDRLSLKNKTYLSQLIISPNSFNPLVKQVSLAGKRIGLFTQFLAFLYKRKDNWDSSLIG